MAPPSKALGTAEHGESYPLPTPNEIRGFVLGFAFGAFAALAVCEALGFSQIMGW